MSCACHEAGRPCSEETHEPCGCSGGCDEPALTSERSCGSGCGCHDAPEPSVEKESCGCGGACHASERAELVQHSLKLEYFTVGWNIIEGLVSVAAALAAGSVALLGFGIDSFVETTSGAILIWRLLAERKARSHEEIERLDQRAHKLVGLSLFLLAAYVAFDAAHALYQQERPEPTLVGIGITTLSLAMMGWLARAKRRAARGLGSKALEADSFQTTACFWLSLITLGGIGLNAMLGWWWADPVAALAMTWFLVAEGRQAWRGEDCGCAGPKPA
ncbi:MAG: cation transporter [Myxococcales bacterium]